MRLIDADALPEMEIERCDTTDAFEIKAKVAGRNHMRKIINDAPTLDVMPVIHGEWFRVDEYIFGEPWECSNCETTNSWRSRYCPNCGAKMDGEKG